MRRCTRACSPARAAASRRHAGKECPEWEGWRSDRDSNEWFPDPKRAAAAEVEIAQLRDLDLKALQARWHSLRGGPAPRYLPKTYCCGSRPISCRRQRMATAIGAGVLLGGSEWSRSESRRVLGSDGRARVRRLGATKATSPARTPRRRRDPDLAGRERRNSGPAREPPKPRIRLRSLKPMPWP